MNSCTFVILGASGDLAKRYLIPALYRLIIDKKIDRFLFIGAAIDEVTIETILDSAREFISGDIDESVWKVLQKNSHYQKLDFKNVEDFKALNELATKLEKKQKLPGNRLVYLSAAASFFCDITENLAASALVQKMPEKQLVWHRIVYEKPFGHDLKSAHEINECIAKYFEEHQIYRIDHYLTKELVNNIALVRFTNAVFEPVWDNRYIDYVQIIANEKDGVLSRGPYYDTYGAVSDFIQNHLLQLSALVAMDAPEKLYGDFIRDKRADVLKKVKFIDGILGQYEGYKKEKGVAPDSKTETFAALRFELDIPRWAGVPFYLKQGKCLGAKETLIHIKFKQVDCLLKVCPRESNYLTIRITPEASFFLGLNAKKPGVQEVMPVNMEFCHHCLFGTSIPTAHETLLEGVINGEKSMSVRFDEIEYAWEAVDKIPKDQLPLYTYECGSKGPKELKDFEHKHGMRWLT